MQDCCGLSSMMAAQTARIGKVAFLVAMKEEAAPFIAALGLTRRPAAAPQPTIVYEGSYKGATVRSEGLTPRTRLRSRATVWSEGRAPWSAALAAADSLVRSAARSRRQPTVGRRATSTRRHSAGRLTRPVRQ